MGWLSQARSRENSFGTLDKDYLLLQFYKSSTSECASLSSIELGNSAAPCLALSRVYLTALRLQGYQVDELFGPKRDERLKFNAVLAERSPAVTGKQPLRRFKRSRTVWQEYWPSPTADYYAEALMFTACHYRNRYAYDYSIQFDIDEFWTPTTKSEEKLLPDFLDRNMKKNSSQMLFTQVLEALPLYKPFAAAVRTCQEGPKKCDSGTVVEEGICLTAVRGSKNFLLQMTYPLDCQTRTSGEYTTRFSLRLGPEGQSKPAVRPETILRSASFSQPRKQS